MRFFGGQCVFWLRPAERKCSRQFALWRCSLKGFGTFFQITALQLLSKPQWFAVRWFNVIPRPEVVKVIADLLRDKYPILATNVRNRQRLLLMIMMVEGPTFSLPAFTTPPRRRSGHFYCVLTTPSVCPGHNQVLLFKSAPSKTICRASKQAYSCCKSSKLFP